MEYLLVLFCATIVVIESVSQPKDVLADPDAQVDHQARGDKQWGSWPICFALVKNNYIYNKDYTETGNRKVSKC